MEWRLVNRRTLLNKQGDKMTATGEEQGGTTHCPKMKMNDKKFQFYFPGLLIACPMRCLSGQLR